MRENENRQCLVFRRYIWKVYIHCSLLIRVFAKAYMYLLLCSILDVWNVVLKLVFILPIHHKWMTFANVTHCLAFTVHTKSKPLYYNFKGFSMNLNQNN